MNKGTIKYETAHYHVVTPERKAQQYTVIHSGTKMSVPHLGLCVGGRSPADGITFHYLADAKKYADWLETFPEMATPDKPTREALVSFAHTLRARIADDPDAPRNFS